MSTLKADTIQNTSGGAATLTKQYAVKTWANTNMTSTQSNRDSFNISSITDGGTGGTTLAITSNMSDANYAGVAERGTTTSNAGEISFPYNTFTNTSSQCAFCAFSVSYAAFQDITNVSTALIGDLA